MSAPLTRAQQLALRRKLMAEAAKRRPARAVPRAQLPRPTQYTRALIDFAEELNAAFLGALADEGLPAPRSDADGEVPPFGKGDLLARIRRLAEQVVKRRGSAINAAIQAVSANVYAVSKAQWARQAKAVVGVDLSAVEPNLAPVTERFRRENLDLIVSMAKDKVSRVTAILDEAPNARVETIRDRILDEGAVTKRQAALIARDQVLSLNAQVTQRRHEAAGITRYVWRTSGDGDVRPAHRALDGKTFSYDDPPVVDPKKGRREHPGQDYQCRCTAEPIIEGLDEAAKVDRRDAGDFNEREHPRDHGKFTEKGTGGGGPTQAKPPKGEGHSRGTETTGSAAGEPPGRRGSIPSEAVERIAAEHGVPPKVVEEFANSRARPNEEHLARVAKEGGEDGVRLAAKLGAQGMSADKAVELSVAVSHVPGGHARTERVAALGQSHKEAARMATHAHAEGLSEKLDAALDDIGRGRAKVTGNAAGSHEFIQAVEYVKNHGGGALDLDKRKTAVEGFHEEPDGTRTYVSLKCHTKLKKVGNIEHKIMDDEGKIRGADRAEAKKLAGEQHPPLVGHSALHMAVNFSSADVRAHIGDEPRDDERRTRFMRHIVPSAAERRPCYKEITLVCGDADLVLKPDGSLTQREKSRL